MKSFSSFFMALSLLLITTLPAAAQSLTRAERTVCASLRQCMDIIARHDASEFDYAVLAEEFRRFGPKGRAALFRLLQSDDGRADIAEIFVQLGPLSTEDRAIRDAAWGGPQTAKWLPLADQTSSWVTLLGHPDRTLRERANAEIFFAGRQNRPVVIQDYAPLLSFLKARPSRHLAQHLTGVDVERHRQSLQELLLSGERHTTGAAYAALYRDDPATAFEALLRAMRNLKTVDQAVAIGSLLAERDTGRPDGFYRKFAADFSGNRTHSATARAAALDGYLKIIAANPGVEFPTEISLAQRDALSFLLSEANLSAPAYAAGLAKISAADLPALWTHLDTHVVPNTKSALPAFAGTAFEREILKAALNARDGDVRIFAQNKAKAFDIALPMPAPQTCSFKPFDIVGLRDQMPFFEDGFVTGSWPQFRVPASRRFLRAAHPTRTGWLAGYDRGEFGGGLIYYNNRTGEGTDIPFHASDADLDQWTPNNVVAILPDRLLPLGQMAQAFWVITEENTFGASGPTVFRVEETSTGFTVKRLAHNIGAADRVSVSPEGDLLMASVEGATIRLSPEGKLPQGCSTRGGELVRARN